MRKYSPLLALASLIAIAILVVFVVRAAKEDAVKASQAEAVLAQHRAEEKALAEAEENIGSVDEWTAALQRRNDHLKKLQDELQAAQDAGADSVEIARRQLNLSLDELAVKRLEAMRP